MRGAERGLGVASWVFLSPWFVAFLLFGLFPIGYSFFLSFHDYSPLAPDRLHFLGFSNYREAISDPTFWTAMRNTFVFTLVSQAAVIFLGNILARALMKKFWGKSVVRFLILMPWAAPISLATLQLLAGFALGRRSVD